jgi:aryl-alcohol dehydrogenase-like predicted oxidoreductase
LQSSELDRVAEAMGVTPMQVALAWLLQRSSNILLIPGTSSLKHLRENLNASTLRIPAEMIADLDSIGGAGSTNQ